MYKCPKCGSTESFYADCRIIFSGCVQFDGNAEVIDMEEIDMHHNFEIMSDIGCDECGYEAPEDEFEE